MNVWVHTVDGETHVWDDAAVTFDTNIIQIAYKTCTTTFPLCNVVEFSIDEATS